MFTKKCVEYPSSLFRADLLTAFRNANGSFLTVLPCSEEARADAYQHEYETLEEQDLAFDEERETVSSDWQSYIAKRELKYPIVLYGDVRRPIVESHPRLSRINCLPFGPGFVSEAAGEYTERVETPEEALQFLNQEIIYLSEELLTQEDYLERLSIKSIILRYYAERSALVEEANRVARTHARAQKLVIKAGEASHRVPELETHGPIPERQLPSRLTEQPSKAPSENSSSPSPQREKSKKLIRFYVKAG